MNKFLQFCNGYQYSQIAFVAAKLGIADILKEGPKTADEISATLNADVDFFSRYLRAAASISIFERDPYTLKYSLNDFSSLLVEGEGSLKYMVLHLNNDFSTKVWSQLERNAVKGENSVQSLVGMNIFEYYKTDQENQLWFNNAMTTISMMQLNSTDLVDRLESVLCHPIKHLVDVGGGHGSFATKILQNSKYPDTRATVFDLPHVVEDVEVPTELRARLNFVGGDFFQSVPAGGDVYTLKFILHDWKDEKAIRILKNVVAAMPTGAKVIVIDKLLGETNDAAGAISDLHMMLFCDAKERTQSEFKHIFGEAGLKLTNVVIMPPAFHGACAIIAERA